MTMSPLRHRWRYSPSGWIIRPDDRSEEHTSELQSQSKLICRLLLEKKNNTNLRPAHRYQHLQIPLTIAETPPQRFAQRHAHVADPALRPHWVRGPRVTTPCGAGRAS